MKTLALRLDLEASLLPPMHAFVVDRPEYGPTRLLQWNPHDGETNLLLFAVDGPREPFLSALSDVETTVAFEASEPPGADGFYLFVTERLTGSDRELVAAFTDEDVLVVPPIVYDVDGSMHLTVVGESAALQRSIDRAPAGVTTSVVRIRSGAVGVGHGGSALSDRQQEAVAAAVAAGYYEEPRTATLDDVGERLDCAPSTAAEHLRKAEATLLRRAVPEPSEE